MEKGIIQAMNKILILNYGLHISGVSRVLVNLANALAERGYDVTIKLETEDDTLQNLLSPKIKVLLFLDKPLIFRMGARGFLRYYYFWKKRIFKMSPEKQYKKIVKEKYDVEIAFNRGAAARIISASTNKNCKKLVWVHTDMMKSDSYLAGFTSDEEAKIAYQKFDKIVCVSETVKKSVFERWGLKNNVVVRYNINDEKLIKNSKAEKRNSIFTIVAIGRLSAPKAYDIMLNACKMLNDDNIEYELWIIGDGEDKDKILKLKNKLKLNNVKLLGAKNNPYSYLNMADLYVSSSIYEGLSTTAIEALIAEKPIVVTDCTGMRDILGDSEYGLVVDIDAKSLYNGIKQMINDGKLRNHYIEQAKIRAKDFYKEKTLEQIEMLFN